MSALPPITDAAASAPETAPATAPATALVAAAPVPARNSWAVAAGVLLFVIALGGAALAWRAESRVSALELELVRRQQDSSQIATEARVLARQSDEGMRAQAAKQSLLEARLAEVAVQRSQIEDLIQSLSRSRDENIVVDIETGLRVALQQSALTGSAEPLVAVLRQSDERLSRYNQPRLEGVRRAIARDLDRVKAAGVADIGALTIKLDEAVRMVDELPLLSAAEPRKDGKAERAATAASRPAAAALAGTATASAPIERGGTVTGGLRDLWSLFWQPVWDEVRSLVRVTRIDRPEAALLAPEQATFLRENLKLRLLNARLALLSRQFDTAQADLATAQGMLDRFFDRGARRTQLAAELIRQAQAQARQAGLPKPEDTLAALAAAAAGR